MNERIDDKFPKTKFVKQYKEQYGLEKAIMKQLGVVTGELFEVQDAVSRKDYSHAQEEVIDVIASAMGILYLIPGYTKDISNEKIKIVTEKNAKRGYYDK